MSIWMDNNMLLKRHDVYWMTVIFCIQCYSASSAMSSLPVEAIVLFRCLPMQISPLNIVHSYIYSIYNQSLSSYEFILILQSYPYIIFSILLLHLSYTFKLTNHSFCPHFSFYTTSIYDLHSFLYIVFLYTFVLKHL